MTIARMRGAINLVLLLLLLLLLLPRLSLSKEIPKVQEEQKKESKTKDLIAATSYVYSKNGDGHDSFDHLGPTRFRSLHGLNSGLNFPRFFRRFNYPTRYRVGSFGGVGSDIEDLSSDIGRGRLSLSHGIGKKTFGSGISHLDSHDIDDSIGYHPSGFDLDSHDEPESPLSHDLFEDRQEEYEHKHGNKEHNHVHGSSEAESSKGHKSAEEFDKGEKSEREKVQEAGHHQEEAGVKKGHEDAEKIYKEEEESAQAAKGEHAAHSEGHKKGHKTTGYHNVYHKDEYKKDTTFYDDEHVDAQHEKYSHEDEKHAKAEGEHKKAEKVDSGYEHAEKERKGFFTNGHQYGSAQGHDREEAIKEHHEKENELHNEANHKSSSELAESSGSHH